MRSGASKGFSRQFRLLQSAGGRGRRIYTYLQMLTYFLRRLDPYLPRLPACQPRRKLTAFQSGERLREEAVIETHAHRLHAGAQRDRVIATIAALLLLIGMPIGWLGSNTSTGDAIGFVVATLISLALLAWIFLWLLPRERAAGRAARTSLILAILAFVLIVVFWTGLCFGLAAGAVTLGLSARDAAAEAGGRGKATVAVVLGALVLLVGFVGLLTG
jgi:hypothetical protein